ncbi:class I SAM-dependent methyltransferase [Mucilaginibacter lutimaris]|uniref:Class I SAM-dependent methyltransferase n=1 Tax=Mucilaginibacter lutimaris TaxID=931629 RepID=A0ABW2ZIY5_9SPHI
MHLIDSSIEAFYAHAQEETRLTTGLGPLEFERNKILISRYLHQRCHITDVGGGTGHYAQWLSSLGHSVTLIDPVPKHIQQAKKRSKQTSQPYQCLLAEGRNLPLPDASQQLVILHGPLYHLQERSDRIAALREARRVLRKDGIILGFAINNTASIVAALQSGLIYHPDVFKMCTTELVSGIHQPPAGFPGMLPAAYYHRPSFLIDEFKEVGLKPLELRPVEGIAWMDGSFFSNWADPVKRKRLLELLELTEKDQDLLCFSPHMMLAANVSI